jgi:hypothetical protein
METIDNKKEIQKKPLKKSRKKTFKQKFDIPDEIERWAIGYSEIELDNSDLDSIDDTYLEELINDSDEEKENEKIKALGKLFNLKTPKTQSELEQLKKRKTKKKKVSSAMARAMPDKSQANITLEVIN